MKNKEYLAEMTSAYNAVTESKTPEQLEEADNSAKEKAAVVSAIGHLKMAVKDLQKADKFIKTDDYKYYISEIEAVISTDSGEAGLEPMSKKM